MHGSSAVDALPRSHQRLIVVVAAGEIRELLDHASSPVGHELIDLRPHRHEVHEIVEAFVDSLGSLQARFVLELLDPAGLFERLHGRKARRWRVHRHVVSGSSGVSGSQSVRHVVVALGLGLEEQILVGVVSAIVDRVKFAELGESHLTARLLRLAALAGVVVVHDYLDIEGESETKTGRLECAGFAFKSL